VNILAIVQARMSSSRLPGKVLMEVAGKPLLQYLLERLEQVVGLDGIVVATSIDSSDDPVARFCLQYGVECVRGPLDDVADRFRQVLAKHPCEGFVRVCGDSPLLDSRLVGLAVAAFKERGDLDLVTNTLERDHPDGQSVEVVNSATFQRVYGQMSEPGHFEHVTLYFYHHRNDFNIVDFKAKEDYSGLSFVVDTAADFAAFAALVARMDRPHWAYDLDGLAELARSGEVGR
jgi:spore coat polysaccharide biosynthesis protein SpsF